MRPDFLHKNFMMLSEGAYVMGVPAKIAAFDRSKKRTKNICKIRGLHYLCDPKETVLIY